MQQPLGQALQQGSGRCDPCQLALPGPLVGALWLQALHATMHFYCYCKEAGGGSMKCFGRMKNQEIVRRYMLYARR